MKGAFSQLLHTPVWDGSIQALDLTGRPAPETYEPEDYRFGLYDADAWDADSTAYALPYHLLVRAAGNETGDEVTGNTLAITINGGIPIGYWFRSYSGTGPGRIPVYINFEHSLWVDASDVQPIFSGGVIFGGTVDDRKRHPMHL